MRLHHLALRVADCERARAFYGDLLGLAELRRVEENGALRAVWLGVGDAVLMLERTLRGAGPEAGSGHLLVGSSRVDLQACKLEYSIVSPK